MDKYNYGSFCDCLYDWLIFCMANSLSILQRMTVFSLYYFAIEKAHK
jgi:hypothetical protein